ncbi:Protein of uncharacterised function (DUF795) [Urinicoccus massiliensis]|uniref:tRNA(Met) cytidine acetate ligase n=1 Tax=Urinicoccus massiliensis TaxID=1723382 RepID=A0A8H2QT15_9FIRM|nr:nucleotidyltransferase family protein [Urinicoccus massiliensis]VFB16435.1 Protein of uncharacterised function (DUF795) [Urinicoccus massiliensis]
MIIGVIAEYNPFHNGHYYHLQKLKKTYPESKILICMVGHFSQRGEPTILDKWTRAGCAIQAGADMVFELPFALATSKAESYAQAGTFLLKSLGAQYLSFGSEFPNPENYLTLARKIMTAKEDPDFQELLKQASLPRAIQAWIDLSKEERAILQSPNDILALEYCQAISNFNLGLKLIPIPRLHQDNPYKVSVHSASQLRRWAQDQNHEKGLRSMPPFSYLPYKEADFSYETKLKELFIYDHHFHQGQDQILQDPGIHRYLYKNWVVENRPLKELSTKKYTQARLQRDLIHLVFGLSLKDQKDLLDLIQDYHRLLAARRDSLTYLRPYKLQTKFVKGLDSPVAKIYRMSLQETILRNLLLGTQTPSDYTKSPLIL